MKKLLSVFICLVLCVACISSFMVTASAHSTTEAKVALNVSADCSLKLTFANNGTAFDGRDISIFKVADVDKDLNYTLTGGFADPTVKLSDFDSQDDYSSLAETLYSVSVSKKITSTASAKTNTDGIVSFSNLSVGLYLVSPLGFEQNNMIYKFAPFIVALPDALTDGTWSYDVEALPKSSATEKEKVEYKIVVVWDDKDNKGERPESITFDIFDDGEKVDTVIITEKDNWTYKWSAYDDGSVWTVAETNLPNGYSAAIVRTGNTFTVTNSYYLPPVTSDNSNIIPFIAVLLLSFLALACCTTVLLRKKA